MCSRVFFVFRPLYPDTQTSYNFLVFFIMFLLRSLFVLVSFSTASTMALPSSTHEKKDTGSALADIIGAISAANATKPVMENANPIEGQSYFYIDQGCSAAQVKTYTQAYKDAMALADAAQKWPDYGTDAMDLYMGKGADQRQQYKNVIQRESN
jgi:hypothetical protein